MGAYVVLKTFCINQHYWWLQQAKNSVSYFQKEFQILNHLTTGPKGGYISL